MGFLRIKKNLLNQDGSDFDPVEDVNFRINAHLGRLNVRQNVAYNLTPAQLNGIIEVRVNNYKSITLTGTGVIDGVTFLMGASSTVTITGALTIKNSSFKKSGTSNFYQVSISGSTNRTFENVHIEGAQYGFNVVNVPQDHVSFKNVSGESNFYATIKTVNSNIKIDGFNGNRAIQDGIGAYTNSYVNLQGTGNVQGTGNLIGLRSAYTSEIYMNGTGQLYLTGNTHGINVYQYGKVNITSINSSAANYVLLNNYPSVTYPAVVSHDIVAATNGYVHIGNPDFDMSLDNNIIDIYNDGTADIVIESVSIKPVVAEKFSTETRLEKLDNSSLKEAKSRKEFIREYQNYQNKDEMKLAKKELVSSHSKSNSHEIRSIAKVLDILNTIQDEDYSWVNHFDKVARLKPYLQEDAVLIAEQLFYYYTNTEPQQTESAYWLNQLKEMNHEAYETGIFDVLYEQASFNQEIVETQESEQAQTDDNTILAYPNPFNPTTSLKLSLKNKAQVQIQVFDVMGRLVQTLANNEQWQSGTHEVQFDASRLASGMYFARTQILESGKAVQTQVTKLMLIK